MKPPLSPLPGRGLAALLAALSLAAGAAAAAADWTQWRGPRRDGTIPEFKAPASWPEKLTRRWKVEVGEGHSSPLIVGERAFIHAREGENEVIRCLSLETGKDVWRHSYPAPYEMHPAARGHGKGPKSTPTYTDGRLYTLGITGILSCVDAKSGQLQWRYNPGPDYPVTSPLYGTAVSPLVDGRQVIVHVGGPNKGALTSFDSRSGAVRWRWTGDGPAYSTPILVKIDGTRQLITQSQKLCIGVSPENGELLWQLPFTTPFDQSSVTPVAAGGLIVFGGTRQPTFACRVRKGPSGWSAERVWETRDVTLYMSTPVASGNRLYGLSERQRGQLFTLDMATGKTLWSDAGRTADNAALLDGGPVLLVLTTDGDLRILKKTGDTLTEAARYEVAEGATWASPAVAGRRLLVKDVTALYLWDLPR